MANGDEKAKALLQSLGLKTGLATTYALYDAASEEWLRSDGTWTKNGRHARQFSGMNGRDAVLRELSEAAERARISGREPKAADITL
jgi:hypothetical protein